MNSLKSMPAKEVAKEMNGRAFLVLDSLTVDGKRRELGVTGSSITDALAGKDSLQRAKTLDAAHYLMVRGCVDDKMVVNGNTGFKTFWINDKGLEVLSAVQNDKQLSDKLLLDALRLITKVDIKEEGQGPIKELYFHVVRENTFNSLVTLRG